MAKLNIFRISLLAFLGLASACDIIEGPKKDYSNVIQNSDKKILIEDFTGHYCGNCPDSHRMAEELDSVFHGNVVVLAVHAGNWFGGLHPPTYTIDWRTQMGIDIETYWAIEAAGFPKGLVNRKEIGGSRLTSYTTWTSLIPSLLNEEPSLGIEMTSAYDSATGTANIGVQLEYFANSSGIAHNLVVVIKEDSVIAPQKDYDATPEDVMDYVHMDMLRGNITSDTWGEDIGTNTVTAGQVITRNFTYTVNPAWVAKNCEVVAYIMDANTREILQVEEIDLFGN